MLKLIFMKKNSLESLKSIVSKKTKHRIYEIINFLKKHRFFLFGSILVAFWCFPYITTGSKMEYGDFSFFSQAYEAIKISILDYHQFPWWNPWVSGGVPLYANPQIGLFSIQTIFTLVFNAPVGLKLSLILYTFLGYYSMYILSLKYLKIDHYVSTVISLLWIFCSFFVAHLPTHYSFAWYMLIPLFLYLSFNLNGWRSGILLGLAFGIMANSQIHNAFVHIALVCGVSILFKMCFRSNQKKRIQILVGSFVAVATFILIAGHRFLFVFENNHDFPRNIIDTTPPLFVSIYGLISPYPIARFTSVIKHPLPPFAPHGFHEISATIGIFAIFSGIISLLFCVFCFWQKKRIIDVVHIKLIFLFMITCLLLGLGNFTRLAPYNILKHLPILSDMRVPSRWFIWVNLAFLIFIGLVTKIPKKRDFAYISIVTLLSLGVVELFVLNVGYQSKILVHQPASVKFHKHSDFNQQSYFGSINKTSTGLYIPDSDKPQPYREYDSTMFNLGVLYANDSFVQIHLAKIKSYRCGIDKDCNLVLTKNAKIISWSPNEITLKRTGNGEIKLNMNESNYITINGKRKSIKTAEPFEEFVINDSSEIIKIKFNPSAKEAMRALTSPKPSSDY